MLSCGFVGRWDEAGYGQWKGHEAEVGTATRSAPEQRRRVVEQRRWGVERTKAKKTYRQPARRDLWVKVVRLRILRRLAHRTQFPIEVASTVVRQPTTHQTKTALASALAFSVANRRNMESKRRTSAT
ncbi:hypothetical protein C8R44DRAFT_747810 [Mycena epipterygia]|nr:hypothetical protein C8R44DRAFT_747810 [Mycena epipterygia]